MYLDYYNLKIKPFQITADPKFLWLGEKHKEALATLRYGILDNRGFLLLTGEVGTGKTILINRLITLLDVDTVVATLSDPDLESMDFYNLLADGLKMERTFDSKGAFLIHLRDFLHHSYASQQQVLLVIDESQRLNHRLMEDIRVLSNIELHDRKLINIFFVGQQEFNSILMAPQNRALSQRITVRYHIEPLDQKEIGEYVIHRLKVAGRTKPIFNKSAIKEVFEFSGGIPRLINIICDHALLTGYARGIKQIDNKIIAECAEELRIPATHFSTEVATMMDSGANFNKGAEEQPAKLWKAISQTANQVEPSQKSEPAIAPGLTSASNNKSAAERAGKPLPAAWKLTYATVVLLLVALLGFAITKFTGGPAPRWGEDELTPQKYKTSLEKEKAILADRMDEGEVATGDDISSGDNNGAKNQNNKPEPAGRSSGKKTDENIKDLRPDESGSASNPIEGSEARRPAEPLYAGKSTADQQPLKPETVESATENAGSLKADFVNEEIEPLPLMKEKILIHFDINSNEIDEASFPALDRIAAYLVQHPDEVIHVRGYTDSSGSPGYNESVSRFRANAVKSYLIGKGASADKIKVFAMGAQNPITSNDSYAGRRMNRRVEIEFPENTDPAG